MKSLGGSGAPVVASNGMLTGDQIAAARRMAGFHTQKQLSAASGVSQPTIARAEKAGANFPTMASDSMADIISAVEKAGVIFTLAPGASLAGGMGMVRRK